MIEDVPPEAHDYEHDRWGLYRWEKTLWHVWEPGSRGSALCGLPIPRSGFPPEGPRVFTMLTKGPTVPHWAGRVSGDEPRRVCAACRYHANAKPLRERMEEIGFPRPLIQRLDGKDIEARTAYEREGWQ